ncbi:hypothetical protein GCM10023341_22070 [Ornithinimicrobium tianjinense]
MTLLTFVLALTALPDRVPYPFTDPTILAQWPGDYYWMFPAMALMVLFVAFVAVLNHRAPADRKVFGTLALTLAGVAAAVLLIDYYVQATVLPLSLERGELEGYALFTQYNPHGVFIALEELGYLLMSLVFLALVPTLSRTSRAEAVARWIFAAAAGAVAGSLVVVTLIRGRDRADSFEIIVISIVWLTLIVTGPLLARAMRRDRSAAPAA